jgi:hypothetical protein
MSSTVESAVDIRPFRADIAEEQLAELRRRIAATRWPTKELVADASQGVQSPTIQELARYWASEHDWRRCEARLNALPQFRTEIDGVAGPPAAAGGSCRLSYWAPTQSGAVRSSGRSGTPRVAEPGTSSGALTRPNR